MVEFLEYRAGQLVEFVAHTMRRSIGTLVGRDKDHGPEVGMKLLGHRELSTFVRHYMERDKTVTNVTAKSAQFGRPTA